MYKGNNAISSVIKGSSNIAKILFNGIEVWRKVYYLKDTNN